MANEATGNIYFNVLRSGQAPWAGNDIDTNVLQIDASIFLVGRYIDFDVIHIDAVGVSTVHDDAVGVSAVHVDAIAGSGTV